MSATDCAGAAAERPRRVEMEKRLLLLVSLRPLSRLLVSFGPLSDRELGALLGREDDEPMSCGRGWASQKSQRNLSFENGVTGTMLHGITGTEGRHSSSTLPRTATAVFLYTAPHIYYSCTVYHVVYSCSSLSLPSRPGCGSPVSSRQGQEPIPVGPRALLAPPRAARPPTRRDPPAPTTAALARVPVQRPPCTPGSPPRCETPKHHCTCPTLHNIRLRPPSALR